jgi:hypothetical protein
MVESKKSCYSCLEIWGHFYLEKTWCWGQGGEMTQAMYAHMNNKTIKKKKKKTWCSVIKTVLNILFTI